MKKSKWLLFVAVVLTIVQTGCPLGQKTTFEYGLLVVSFETSTLEAQTIGPPLDTDVAWYDVAGTGPDSATFLHSGLTGTTVSESALYAGDWLIVVDAFNSDGVLIGTGNTTVTVVPDELTLATVDVGPLDGVGILDIDISWPAGALTTPAIVATLTPLFGTLENLTFTPGTDSASYDRSDLDAGYYQLSIQLQDGGVTRWGMFESVRILKDQTTSLSLTLTLSDINASGLDVIINTNLLDPMTIMLNGYQPMIPEGNSMLVEATTSDDPVDSYQWYLHGAPLLGETGASISVGAGLAVGTYRLDLEVIKANVASSENIVFLVDDPPTEIVQTNLAETGTGIDVYLYFGPDIADHPPLYSLWIENAAGDFVQNIMLTNAVGTNIYPFSGSWVARPMSVPYWAHKACIEDPYSGDPSHNSTGMYLALPTVDGGPIPADLDAVTSASRLVDLQIDSARVDDGLTQFRVLLEINVSRDFNTVYTDPENEPGGQPSLIYAVDIDLSSGQTGYAMSLLGAGHEFGTDGGLYSTADCTTALDLVDKVLVFVN